MEERNEISVELSALSALVGGISRQTPYGVPAGYFDQFPALLMSRIAGSESGSGSLSTLPAAGILPAAATSPETPTFQVPDGYFDGFAAQVLTRIKAGSVGEEALPPIFSRISRVTPYQVPEGYFEELSPVLAVLRDKPAYAVPQGYFDELSPVLTVAHDRSTYQVPEGYFAELPERILEKVTVPVTAGKVIPMRREGGKVLKGHWWKYSSVAAIAACLLLIFSWPQADTKHTEGAMTLDVAQALQKVSDKEMQAYLDDQHSILAEPVNTSTATLEMNEGDVKSLLGEVSDDDLQQYMEEHGKADDLATN
jgi:hypothetical protein